MNNMTARNIGINVNPPKAECNDPNCPYHGTLPVRGQIIDGKVVSVRMDKTAVVEKHYLKYQEKYERYEKRTGRYMVHAPSCFELKVGVYLSEALLFCSPAQTPDFQMFQPLPVRYKP